MIQRRRGRQGEAGQAMTETMLVLSFLMLMVMGTITLCLLMTTKQLADYAAFGAARVVLSRGFQQAGLDIPVISDIFDTVIDVPFDVEAQAGWPSAAQVLYNNQHWWESATDNLPGLLQVHEGEPSGAHYIVVPYRVPYGMPIFNELDSGGLLILGRSRVIRQPSELIWSPFE